MVVADLVLRHQKSLLEIDEGHCNPSANQVQLPQTARSKDIFKISKETINGKQHKRVLII
jgi:hypothetical protein